MDTPNIFYKGDIIISKSDHPMHWGVELKDANMIAIIKTIEIGAGNYILWQSPFQNSIKRCFWKIKHFKTIK